MILLRQFIPFLAIAFIIFSCKKDSANNPYDVAHNTAAQNALLIQGHWIQDSFVNDNGSLLCYPPSQLDIDSNLHYFALEAFGPIGTPRSDTGRFVFNNNRGFEVDEAAGLGGNGYLYSPLNITLVDNHHLVLFYQSLIDFEYFYYHK